MVLLCPLEPDELRLGLYTGISVSSTCVGNFFLHRHRLCALHLKKITATEPTIVRATAAAKPRPAKMSIFELEEGKLVGGGADGTVILAVRPVAKFEASTE